jgi:hypothetical protein
MAELHRIEGKVSKNQLSDLYAISGPEFFDTHTGFGFSAHTVAVAQASWTGATGKACECHCGALCIVDQNQQQCSQTKALPFLYPH